MIHILKCLVSFPRKRESRSERSWIPNLRQRRIRLGRKVGNDKQDGVILLLVVIILTAIFSISIGVFGVIIRQVSTSETFESSNIAFYAADQSIERLLYRDRQENDFPCSSLPVSPCTTVIPQQSVASGGCMGAATVVKIENPAAPPAAITQISVRGLNTSCGTVTERTVARAFLTTY